MVVERIYSRIFSKYPDPNSLSNADPDQLWEISQEAGLRRRTLGLIDIASAVVKCGVVPDRQFLLSLPFVGDYITDAVLLYAFGEKTFPLDRNVQRLLHRALLGRDPPPRKNTPYKDGQLAGVIAQFIGRVRAANCRKLHQAILHLAWESCRGKPICGTCEIRALCKYSVGLTTET